MLGSLIGLACPQGEVSSLIPATQAVRCISKWRPDRILLVAELDCIPCQKLLERMRKEMPAARRKAVEVLWLNADPASCLQASLRGAELGEVGCAKRQEVELQWGVHSTPVVFWLEGERKLRVDGLIEKPKKLPWQ